MPLGAAPSGRRGRCHTSSMAGAPLFASLNVSYVTAPRRALGSSGNVSGPIFGRLSARRPPDSAGMGENGTAPGVMGGIRVTTANIAAIAESAARSARKDVFAPPLCVGLPAPRRPARRGTVGLGAPRMGDFSLAPAAEPPGAMSERALRDEGNAREPPEHAPRSRVWAARRGGASEARGCWKKATETKMVGFLWENSLIRKNGGCCVITSHETQPL